MNAVMPSGPVPNSLRDAPALIERIWPAQKISVETRREFDAHGAQTLTALGSYWKGRKRLIYVRACVLGALLPATDQPEKDLAIFEMLMGMDDQAFLARDKTPPSEIARLAIQAGEMTEEDLPQHFWIKRITEPTVENFREALMHGRLVWREEADVDRIRLAALGMLTYADKVSRALRPEELPEAAHDRIWVEVNKHLGTSASSIPELIEQLGIMRFGHRPRVADTFSGAGSIPFEAARVGCDVLASDLNPIACMLTWGALRLLGGGDRLKASLEAAQQRVSAEVERRISEMSVEHDEHGNRAKAYLYCVEVRCPTTGWLVPVLPSLVISRVRRTIGRLVENAGERRIDVEIVSGVSEAELAAAKLGTLRNRAVIYEIEGREYRTPMATIRHDYRLSNGDTGNQLRAWDKIDIVPRADDILGERLYCIQWIKADTIDRGRPTTYFAGPTQGDLDREDKVLGLVRENLDAWQASGFIPEMAIEDGVETRRLLRERGWTHWHQLYGPRHLLVAALVAEAIAMEKDEELRACLAFDRTFLADKSSRLSQWRIGSPGREGRAASADSVEHVFYNQALNPFFNFGARGYPGLRIGESVTYRFSSIETSSTIATKDARQFDGMADIFITDPPYADAVNYHEITEFFIAWLRKNPPGPFKDWVWDSRRALAIKGDGEPFRVAMVGAYKTMTEHMPDNGIQIVMFTHLDTAVWADMAQIFWGAGLQVMAAWYVATEAMSDIKKGGYVQGTVTLVLRKRGVKESGYKDEIVQEVKAEVAEQIDTMTGLNQNLKGHGRVENLFEDADLQMAGYAAALRVLTRYSTIDGTDMAAEALRPRAKGEGGLVADIIDFAVQVANEHMVPEGMPAPVWERLTGTERWFFKMMDIERAGIFKLDNYQNFAKAFRVVEYADLMGSLDPGKTRLKTAREFGKAGFEAGEFGPSRSRALLFAVWEISNEVEGEEVLAHLRDLVPGYINAREELMALADYIARKHADEGEARCARILHGLIRNERLG